ncbi:hypothetical protein [Candidatus Nitrotoga arctica]|uniref:Lipoprotein n=1 Tax=Candidatus Nitrotoga arctica TaxID=453162 RepID=A0ABN8AK83_9PROT|nr:hypothetical protein [Candidatus Nitrotoga arctica]CAG9931991.1 protein of unknown function [Candidatus Nitrotoga arctica]
MIRLTCSAVILCALTLTIPGCINPSEMILHTLQHQTLQQQTLQQQKMIQQALQQEDKKKEQQEKATVELVMLETAKLQSLLRTCEINGEILLRKDGELMSQCQAIKLFIGKWQGTLKFQDELTINLDIFGLKNATKDKVIFTAKAVVTSNNPNTVYQQTALLLSGIYDFYFYPSNGFIRAHIHNFGSRSTGSFLSYFNMGLARMDGKNYLSGHASVSGGTKIPNGYQEFETEAEVRLTHSVHQIEQIPAIRADTILDRETRQTFMLSKQGIAYWFKYVENLIGDDIEKRLYLANSLFDMAEGGGCDQCYHGAIRNYLIVEGKVPSARVQLRISKSYDGLGNVSLQKEAKRWRDMAAPVMAQAQAICMSRPAVGLATERLDEMNYQPRDKSFNDGSVHDHAETILILLSRHWKFSSISPAEVSVLNERFVCNYTMKRPAWDYETGELSRQPFTLEQNFDYLTLGLTIVPEGKQHYTASWDDTSSPSVVFDLSKERR